MKRVFVFIILLFALSSGAQTLKPNTTEFVTDCMRVNERGNSKQLVIWMPYIFWQFVGEQMKAPPEFVAHLTVEMKNYTLFCVADYTLNGTELKFKTDEEIRKTLRLTDSLNNVYRPLAESEISPDAKMLLKNLEPVMAQIMGQFGEGMRLYLFRAEKVNGEPTLNVAKPNRFTLSWDDVKLSWKLPLASVLPLKKCPVDKEAMKGNWNFCPEHGVRLSK